MGGPRLGACSCPYHRERGEIQLKDTVLRHAETDDELRACFPVMHELRPALQGPDDFVQRVRRMATDTYRLLAVWRDDAPVALAGYRLQENLIYDRFLYVDDLIVTQNSRGSNFGARLLSELSALAQREGCRKLVLDTAMSNSLAQRFYFREGLLTGALRFSKLVAKENA